MAIDMKQSYIQKAHRLSLYNVADSVGEVQKGQLFQLNTDGEWEYADGTKRAYPTLNQRFPGQGLGNQGERLEGRDDVSRAGKLAVLSSGFEIATDQYDEEATYTLGAALHPSTEAGKEGLITIFDSANTAHDVANIRGYVTALPTADFGMLRYEG